MIPFKLFLTEARTPKKPFSNLPYLRRHKMAFLIPPERRGKRDPQTVHDPDEFGRDPFHEIQIDHPHFRGLVGGDGGATSHNGQHFVYFKPPAHDAPEHEHKAFAWQKRLHAKYGVKDLQYYNPNDHEGYHVQVPTEWVRSI